MSLTSRELKAAARALIKACGGGDEASANCRVSASKLSDYGNVDSPLYMPADVIGALEEYCGDPIFSRRLVGCFDEAVVDADLRDSAEAVTEDAAKLQADVRERLRKGSLSPRDVDAIAHDGQMIEEALERVRGVLRGAEAGLSRTKTPLKAV